MKKYLLSGAIILAFVLYVLRGYFGKTNVEVNQPNNSSSHETTNPGGINPTPNPTPTPTPTQAGKYKDGSYVGNVADAFYGPLQVEAVVKNGRITDVIFLQYPNDVENSRQINQASNPILRQEAISAQSAQVDIVTGATQSSEAFRESLATALSKAL